MNISPDFVCRPLLLQRDIACVLSDAILADAHYALQVAVLPITPLKNETPRTASRRAGAEAARQALLAVGCDMPLPQRKGPVPSWPNGFTGSIAHTAALAVAVAAPKSAIFSLGVDIELTAALPTEDASYVLSEFEQSFVTSDALATVVWSAKEFVYKAWCTAIGAELASVDPRNIEIKLDGNHFSATALGDLSSQLEPLGIIRGHLRQCGPLIVTLAVLTA